MIHHKSRLLGVLSSQRMLALGTALLAATFVVRSPAFRESVRYSLQGLALMPLFCGLFWSNTAPAWLRAALESRFLVYVGTVSYSLYLYNGFDSVLGVQNHLLGFFIVSVPATLASFYLVERPARRHLPVVLLKALRKTVGLGAREGQN
jgi:peptidoglycan/LPS O-acetylase OafA/YrhL